MKICLRTILTLITMSLPSLCIAQGMGAASVTVPVNPYAQVQTPWLVAGKVRKVDGEAVKGALVTVAPTLAAQVRTLATNAEGQFRTEYQLNAAGVDEFNVVITVKKKGYKPAHAYVSYSRSAKTWEVPIKLRENQEDDPSLLSLSALISGLAPSMRTLGIGDGISEKSQKNYARGVEAFLDQNHLERAIPLFAEAVQRDLGCISCRTMMGLAELAWNDWEDGSRSLAESVNAALADRKKGRAEPLVAYGTWLNWQHEPEQAEPYFTEALKYAPRNSLALQELGRTLVAERKFDRAADDLESALNAGAGDDGRLLYVQALVGAGRTDSAAAEMDRYLNGRDVKKLPIEVRQVWTSVQNRKAVAASYTKAPQVSERLDFLTRPPESLLAGLNPATGQTELPAILDSVGAKIEELLKDFPNTSSLEAVQQQKLGRKGQVEETQKQNFRYLCLVPREKWGPGFIEYRADSNGNAVMPKGLSEGFMLTQGFNSTALFFHPSYRSETEFKLLGRETAIGQDTYVLAFAQIPGKAHLTGNFRKGQGSYTTFSQGLAWVDAATSRIVRIHAELLEPLPELGLEKQSMDVYFHEIRFARLNQTAWLPDQVLVTLEWNGKLLRNRHEYSDYMAFDVNATEKIGPPKVATTAPSTRDNGTAK